MANHHLKMRCKLPIACRSNSKWAGSRARRRCNSCGWACDWSPRRSQTRGGRCPDPHSSHKPGVQPVRLPAGGTCCRDSRMGCPGVRFPQARPSRHLRQGLAGATFTPSSSPLRNDWTSRLRNPGLNFSHLQISELPRRFSPCRVSTSFSGHARPIPSDPGEPREGGGLLSIVRRSIAIPRWTSPNLASLDGS